MIKIVKVEHYKELSRQAANIISAQMILKPDCVLGLATGSSPVGTYRQLVEWYQKGDLDFSEVTTINLDEYCGLDGSSDQSYRYFMNDNLFSKVNIDPNNTYVPNGKAADPEEECRRYDQLIEKMGGIDLQLLGIGRNGHIGFNEPSDSFTKGTHCVDLGESTIEANARFFENADEVPRRAITMGVGAIMLAKRILLIANGKEKQEILQKALYGPITPRIPASVLQLHPEVTVIFADQ